MIGEEEEKLDPGHRHFQDDYPAGFNMQPVLKTGLKRLFDHRPFTNVVVQFLRNLSSMRWIRVRANFRLFSEDCSELRRGEHPDRQTKYGRYRCSWFISNMIFDTEAKLVLLCSCYVPATKTDKPFSTSPGWEAKNLRS
ncbi:hypothetical protein YC2023_093429 [Brassica napus]